MKVELELKLTDRKEGTKMMKRGLAGMDVSGTFGDTCMCAGKGNSKGGFSGDGG